MLLAISNNTLAPSLHAANNLDHLLELLELMMAARFVCNDTTTSPSATLALTSALSTMYSALPAALPKHLSAVSLDGLSFHHEPPSGPAALRRPTTSAAFATPSRLLGAHDSTCVTDFTAASPHELFVMSRSTADPAATLFSSSRNQATAGYCDLKPHTLDEPDRRSSMLSLVAGGSCW